MYTGIGLECNDPERSPLQQARILLRVMVSAVVSPVDIDGTVAIMGSVVLPTTELQSVVGPLDGE